MRALPAFVAAVVAACVLAACGPAAGGEEASPTCSGLEPGPARTVTRIIDGETLALDDGLEVRLIGALTPRAGDAAAEPGQWPPEIAAIEELQALLLARSVELGYGGDRSDRYGRLQAHVFVRVGEGRRWVQGHLLSLGLARAYMQSGNRACMDALLAAEREAREARRGLWADAAYHVRSADDPAELRRYRSTFQVVEGRLVRVAQVRGVVYLNFDRDWRHAFTATLRTEDRGLLPDAITGTRALEGRLVRVRGWIEQRGGPTIQLSVAGMLEVLEPLPLEGGQRRGSSRPQSTEPQPLKPEAKPPGLIETGR